MEMTPGTWRWKKKGENPQWSVFSLAVTLTKPEREANNAIASTAFSMTVSRFALFAQFWMDPLFC